MKDKKTIAIIILAVVIILGLAAYFTLFKEKDRALNSLNQIKGQLTVMEAENRNLMVVLEKEKQLREELLFEKEKLELTIKTQEEKLAGLSDVQKTIDALNAQIAALRDESRVLKNENTGLKLEAAEVAKENALLKGRKGSAAELKRAIKDLKKRVRQIKKKTNGLVIGGNRGFVIRDGKSTFPAKIRIEVTPAQ
jgi:chromosome segregation ATPase